MAESFLMTMWLAVWSFGLWRVRCFIVIFVTILYLMPVDDYFCYICNCNFFYVVSCLEHGLNCNAALESEVRLNLRGEIPWCASGLPLTSPFSFSCTLQNLLCRVDNPPEQILRVWKQKVQEGGVILEVPICKQKSIRSFVGSIWCNPRTPCTLTFFSLKIRSLWNTKCSKCDKILSSWVWEHDIQVAAKHGINLKHLGPNCVPCIIPLTWLGLNITERIVWFLCQLVEFIVTQLKRMLLEDINLCLVEYFSPVPVSETWACKQAFQNVHQNVYNINVTFF